MEKSSLRANYNSKTADVLKAEHNKITANQTQVVTKIVNKGKLLDATGQFKGSYYLGIITRWDFKKKFNGEAALLFRACFHIEGDWRPFEDGILWEMRGLPRR